ncbi:MAG: hypothetical protein H0X41_03905 [Chitinophagaceae bacterium]|nr:hypothetical protein [Chitinophagaceae bacterium]
MKNDVMHASAHVDRFILKNVLEVKETVATGIGSAKNSARTFGIHDLWNIRRNARFASARIRRV